MIIHLIKYRLQERPKYTQWPKYPGNRWNMPIICILLLLSLSCIIFVIIIWCIRFQFIIDISGPPKTDSNSYSKSKLPQVIDN